MIFARGLVKRFGDFTAVSGVDLDIKEGECFGLLGPNGAGKSTVIGMLYGAALRSGGELSVFGLDPSLRARDIKRRLGVVPQVNALDESLTVFDNMDVYAAFVGVPPAQRKKRVMELLAFMSLDHKAGDSIRTLSGGLQRRLVFVRALLNDPDLLILDEPTTGLDPAVRHLLWAKVKELRADGTTVLLTTHYMHEAEILCDRVAVIDGGKRLDQGSPRELIERHAPGYVGVFRGPDGAELTRREPALEALTALAQKENLMPLTLRPANLEDVFLTLTGKDLDADD